MRRALALAILLVGIGSVHAEPLKLDAPPLATSDPETCPCAGSPCKTLASRTIAGQRVQVLANDETMADMAYLALSAAGGVVYFDATMMRYTPLMGERSEAVQTARDWSHPPSIVRGTLADGTPAAVIRFPWTSRPYDRASERWLGPLQPHAVVLVCALGQPPACSSRIDVDCPAKGCTASLRHGVLALATAGGVHRRPVTR
jgi:hypothetical protein